MSQENVEVFKRAFDASVPACDARPSLGEPHAPGIRQTDIRPRLDEPFVVDIASRAFCRLRRGRSCPLPSPSEERSRR